MLGDIVRGSCSHCSGRVTLPRNWIGIIPPVATCVACGAVAASARVPVIPMQPKPQPIAKYVVKEGAVVKVVPY